MRLIIKENSELDRALCDHLKDDFNNGISEIFIPAGGTPIGFYSELARRKGAPWDELRFFQVDDILNGEKRGEFTQFLKEHLCERFKQVITVEQDILPEGPFSSFLGLGVNGHVAFHEPHLPHEFIKGCVELGPRTLKYLNLPSGTWGLTFGLGMFLKSEKIYLMVKGEHKLDILKRFLNDDESVPAVALKAHPGLHLMVDQETWDLLEKDTNDTKIENKKNLEAC
jgi:6-phosphogluconolactonase/glucosamine-6-phosphate isomerase/deaminase